VVSWQVADRADITADLLMVIEPPAYDTPLGLAQDAGTRRRSISSSPDIPE